MSIFSKLFKRRSIPTVDTTKTYTLFLSNYADLGELRSALKQFPASMIVEAGLTYEGDVLFLNFPDRRMQGVQNDELES